MQCHIGCGIQQCSSRTHGPCARYSICQVDGWAAVAHVAHTSAFKAPAVAHQGPCWWPSVPAQCVRAVRCILLYAMHPCSTVDHGMFVILYCCVTMTVAGGPASGQDRHLMQQQMILQRNPAFLQALLLQQQQKRAGQGPPSGLPADSAALPGPH